TDPSFTTRSQAVSCCCAESPGVPRSRPASPCPREPLSPKTLTQAGMRPIHGFSPTVTYRLKPEILEKSGISVVTSPQPGLSKSWRFSPAFAANSAKRKSGRRLSEPPALAFGKLACGLVRLAPQEGRDFELIVLDRVIHRRGTPVLVEPLRG